MLIIRDAAVVANITCMVTIKPSTFHYVPPFLNRRTEMAARFAWCSIFTLLCLSLLLNPALAKGQGKHKKHKPHHQTLTLTPPPSTDYVPSQPSGGVHPGKGHHGKNKKKHDLDSRPASDGMTSPSPPTSVDLPSLSPAVKNLVSRSFGLSSAPSMAPTPSESRMAAPVVSPAPEGSSSIALTVKSSKGKSFTDDICDQAANPKQCAKILEGKDWNYINSLPPGTTSLLSIELSAAIASKAVLDMSDKMTSNNIDPSKTTCIENYQVAIVGFTGAYANFTVDPTLARVSLNDAYVNIGLCETSLVSGEPQAFLPQIDETNKLLRSLIQLVMKEIPQ